MTSIPAPPWDRHGVHARADHRFGQDDFTQWPQFYTEAYEHLAAVPRKPNTPAHDLEPLWHDVSTDDFEPHFDSTIEGFGRINPEKLLPLGRLMSSLAKRVDRLQRIEDPKSGRLRALCKLAGHSLIRTRETSSLQDLRFVLAECQRYVLELHAMVDYEEVYLPYSRQNATNKTLPTSVAPMLGAFTSSIASASRLFYAGLPVYFIRQSNPPRPLTLIPPIEPSGIVCLDDSTPPHPIIFETTGTEVDASQKMDQIHDYSKIFMFYDPESNVRSKTLELVPNGSHIITLEKLMDAKRSLAALSLSSSAQRPQTKQKPPKGKKDPTPSAGINPFDVPDCELFPKSPSVWKMALKKVDQHPKHRFVDWNQNPSYHKYALPDARLLVSPNSDEKKVQYLIGWLRARPSLIFQASRQLTLSQRKQTWREFLEMLGRDSGKNKDSDAASVRSKILGFYTFLLSTSNFAPASNIQPALPRPVTWRETVVATFQTMSTLQNVFREVTWELNEMNFRLELFAVDCLASRTDIPARRRIEKIARCFEPNAFIPVTLPLEADNGLVANRWIHRIPYVFAFVKILQTWKDCPAPLNPSSMSLDDDIIAEDDFLNLERHAAAFYCQTFFGWFGRAASIPCALYNNST